MQHFLARAHLYYKGNHYFGNYFEKPKSKEKEKRRMFTQPTLYSGTMNGQHKITLSGVVFYVEEECRKLLTDHLTIINRSSSAIASDEMVDERMAEMLLDELKEEGKQVITFKAVKHFIERTKYLR